MHADLQSIFCLYVLEYDLPRPHYAVIRYSLTITSLCLSLPQHFELENIYL
jgi:hypothetical protein